jgi:uncharacterized membrane protein
MTLDALLHSMGYGLCHQLPERSFFGGGVQVPVCARDTGIYFGVVISFVLISVLHRGSRPIGLPTPAGWAMIALMIGAMALDGVTEYAGLRPTTNELRLITGLLSGFAIGAMIAPMVNDELWQRSSGERVLNTPARLALWLLAVPVSYAVVYWGLPLVGVAYPVLVAISIVATLVLVNLVIVCVLPVFERRAESVLDVWAPVLAALALSGLEIWGSAQLRLATVALARSLMG